MAIKIPGQKRKFKTLVFLLSVLLSFAAIGATGLIFYNNTIGYLLNKTTDIHYSTMLQLGKRIELYFSKLENATRTMMSSETLKKELQQYRMQQSSTYEKGMIGAEILKLLYNIKSGGDEIESITLISADGAFFTGGEMLFDIRLEDVLKTRVGEKAKESAGQPVLMYIDEEVAIRQTEFLSRGSTYFLGSLPDADGLEGLILVKVSGKWINGLFGGEDNAAVVSDRNILWQGGSFSEKDVAGLPEEIRSRNDGVLERKTPDQSRLFFKRLALGDLYIVYKENIRSTADKLKNVGTYMLLALIASFAITILLSRITVDRMMDPFYRFMTGVAAYKSGKEPAEEGLRRDTPSVSIRERVVFHLVLSVAIPLTLFVVLYYFSARDVIRQEIIASKQAVFNQTAENIGIYLERKLEALRIIGQDASVQEALAGEAAKGEKLGKVLDLYLSMWNSYDNIRLYQAGGNKIFSTYNGDFTADSQLLADTGAYDMGVNWLGVTNDQYNQTVYNLLYVVKGVNLPPQLGKLNLRTIGYIIYSVNEANLELMYRDINITEHTEALITDSRGIVISHADKNRIGKSFESGDPAEKNRDRSVLRFQREIQDTPFVLSGIYDISTITSDLEGVLYSKLYWIVILLLVIVVVAYETAYLLTRPVGRMNSILKKFRLFDIGDAFPEDSTITEIADLGKTFNEMRDRIERLLDDLLVSRMKQNRLENEKREVEIISLQSQIKPHFLCNTLESIRCLVKEDRKENAMEMLTNVGDLFRYGISKQETIITVAQEIAYAKAYAGIMNMRFGEKIRFEWEVHAEALPCKTLKMLLQPILENAIEHGVARSGEKGCIDVGCRKTEESLVFTVRDNGAGMSPEEVELLWTAGDGNDGHKIGLRNVRKRLSLYYGTEAKFDISSEKERGTEVRIELPCSR